MDGYQRTATLEWWASRSTCLCRLGVRVAVRGTGNAMTCDAFLEPPLSAEDRESFDFLVQLDPFFTLRLGEESTLPVDVVAAGDAGQLVLTASRTEAGESAGCRQVPQ